MAGKLTVKFVDPIASARKGGLVPEEASERATRMVCWQLLVASLVHYEHLIRAVPEGDVAGLINKVTAMTTLGADATAVQVIRGLSALTKRSGKWAEFAASVSSLVVQINALQHEASLIIGARFLPLMVMEAMDSDPDYRTELAMIRAAPTFTHESVMAQLTTRAAAVESREPIRGFPAYVPPVEHKGGRPPGRCRLWTGVAGSCRFGEDCMFSHDDPSTSEHMRPNKGRRGKGGKGEQSTTTPRGKGVCYFCGDDQHGIQTCAKMIAAKAQMAAAAMPRPAGMLARLEMNGLEQYAVDQGLQEILGAAVDG